MRGRIGRPDDVSDIAWERSPAVAEKRYIDLKGKVRNCRPELEGGDKKTMICRIQSGSPARIWLRIEPGSCYCRSTMAAPVNINSSCT
jgi:hypothetical protein